MDMVLLYIDNEPHALAHVLKTVRDHLDEGVPAVADILRKFIQVNVPEIMGRHDPESRDLLKQTVRKIVNSGDDKPDYWEWVARHYIGKHNDGSTMEEYL